MKGLISFVLSFSVMLSVLIFSDTITADAYQDNDIVEGIAVTTASELNIRKGPGTSYDIIVTLPSAGVIAQYHTKKKDVNGVYWYYLTLPDGTKGYCRHDFAQFYYVYYDADFEKQMSQQGFNSEYRKYLRRLHAVYPKWQFVGVKTGFSFEYVIENESSPGQNCVENSYYSDVWKSYEQGNYNFTTKEFVVYDSGGWITASKQAIEYCIDPRNYLSSTTYIFAMENLSYSSTQTEENVKNILSGTFMEKYSASVLLAAQKSGVSAYHLASRMRQEQGTTGNSLGRGDTPGYENYYNFFNINAYAHSGRDAITNGAIYAKTAGSYSRPWNTAYKSILGGGQFLGENYINNGQNTIYFEKFNVVTEHPFTHEYMTNVMAPLNESKSQKSGYSNELINSALVFSIPIYSSLPTNVCKKPSAEGSNNNVVEKLWISGYSFTESFNKYNYSYKAVVEEDCDSVNILATAYDSSATFSGRGKKNLQYGSNKFNIICTAQTGVERIYTVNVYRPYPNENEIADEEATEQNKTAYSVGSTYISGIEEQTSLSDFIKKLNSPYTVKVYSGDSQVKNGIVGTGYEVRLYSGSDLKKTYKLIVLGDINGDGRITALDLLKGQRHILGSAKLTGAYYWAADINKTYKNDPDAKVHITASDLLKGQRHILGTAKLVP